ncbi:MAG: nicotinate-nucleotide adenylyltransferase [Chloroflexota bacterium]|nr:nicotinate-nucleotide adenylyltransferase [Chloroflexota bacterium]
MEKKRLGVFGGTFDPPHVGHLILAAEARDQLNLDCTMWILTPDPPHKHGKKIASLEHRLAMVQLAIEGDESFFISFVDIDRPGPHYTVDTVKLIRQEYLDCEIFYLMGGDSLKDFADWYKPEEILETVDGIGVMRRPGDNIDLTTLIERLPQLAAKINFVTAPLLEISAQQIRYRVSETRAFRYYLLPSVYQYIQDNKLYQE